MENFSLLNLLFLSTPEIFLSLMFSLIVINEGDMVPFKAIDNFKINVFKMLCTSLVISVLGCALDTFFSSMTISSIFTMIFYALSLKLFYKLDWKKSVIGTLAFSMLLITLEAMYSPFCLRLFFDGDQVEFFNSAWYIRVLCALPIRLLQVAAIISLWNFHITLEKLKYYKIKVYRMIIYALLLFFFELTVLNTYMTYFDAFNMFTKITLGLFCSNIGIINFYIPLKYVKIITEVSKFYCNRG